ncbi:MAG: hypothetical protein K0Q48_1463 [Bacillota bacterium]|jgi:hypothetical protein|nr:hypothetical protein [Bacillota bacterium]
MSDDRKDASKIMIEFIPNQGIKDISFGMPRSEVRQKMKELYGITEFAVRNKETECYFDSSLQFSYGENDTLSFIEVAAAPPVYVIIFGIRTWEISGTELLSLLSEKDSINIEISEEGSNPIFKKMHVALWDLDEQYDHIGNQTTPKWGSIGIGDERYYNEICKIYTI